MKKVIVFVSVSLLIVKIIVAQQSMATIQATKQDILLKFNSDSIVWRIEPQKNPDIFYVESSLKRKQAWFITDVDSLYFDIEAGKKYDFIIQYNNQNCYSRIEALENPILLNRYFGFTILCLVLLIVAIIFYKAISIPSNKLTPFGLITPLLFWLFTIIAGFIHGNYNHLKNAVSNLGEIGSTSEIIMAIFTFILAISSMLFSIGFYKESKQHNQNVLPAVLSFAMAISFLWAAIFPAGHQMHGTLGPLPILIIIGALLLALFWKKTNPSYNIKLWSVVSFVFMCLFVLRFIPSIQQHYEGAIQRTLYVGWSTWFISIYVYFKTLNKHNTMEIH
ncbi:MAG: DUF998 domain-containing protein [Ferruginibacter sp.]